MSPWPEEGAEEEGMPGFWPIRPPGEGPEGGFAGAAEDPEDPEGGAEGPPLADL